MSHSFTYYVHPVTPVSYWYRSSCGGCNLEKVFFYVWFMSLDLKQSFVSQSKLAISLVLPSLIFHWYVLFHLAAKSKVSFLRSTMQRVLIKNLTSTFLVRGQFMHCIIIFLSRFSWKPKRSMCGVYVSVCVACMIWSPMVSLFCCWCRAFTLVILFIASSS